MVKINRKVNLALTLLNEEGNPRAYVYSAPLGREVFETYFMTLTKTYAAMVENGSEWMFRMGPRVASLMIKRVATLDGSWSGPDGVEQGLMNEVRRLTNVYVLQEKGWDTIPYDDARRDNLLDADEQLEVENALTFFTCCSASMSPMEGNEFLAAVFGLFGAEVSLLSDTEWMNSLPTSTPAGSSGEKVIQSSIPV